MAHAHVPGGGQDVRHRPGRRDVLRGPLPPSRAGGTDCGGAREVLGAAHEAGSHWVRARLAALEDMAELYDILVDSWRQAAPPRLLEAHPGLVPGAGPATPGRVRTPGPGRVDACAPAGTLPVEPGAPQRRASVYPAAKAP